MKITKVYQVVTAINREMLSHSNNSLLKTLALIKPWYKWHKPICTHLGLIIRRKHLLLSGFI